MKVRSFLLKKNKLICHSLFNDGVFNTNVTITPKDSTAINNPTLVDELPPGLYEVEKNYDDGASQEAIIYKENE